MRVSALCLAAALMLCGPGSAIGAQSQTTPECEAASQLELASPVAAQGVSHPEHVADGWLLPEGWSVDAPGIARFDGKDAFLAWDLGAERALGSLAIQAEARRSFRLLGSLDAREWFVIWHAPQVEGEGLRERGHRKLDARARFLRLDAPDGGASHVSELRVYCGLPDPFPPRPLRRATLVPDPEGVRIKRGLSGKLLVALLGLVLLGPAWRGFSPQRRRFVALGLIVLGALSWVHFGRFAGPHGIHTHEAFHYYLGSKYAPELGYFELYRCVGQAEREAGRGEELEASVVRDLDDYGPRLGTWLASPAGACRADFTPQRWQAFRSDVAAFREILGENGLRAALLDHGFNATPVNTAWLRLWTSWVPPSTTGLLLLGWLDHLQLALAVLVFGWGFGWRAAAMLAVLLGCGGPWDHLWVGGSILRLTWVLCLCGGLAAVASQRWGVALPLLTLAGLLRAFPLAFLAAAVLWILNRAFTNRALSPTHARALGAAALTGILGLAFGSSVAGVGLYAQFQRNISQHSAAPAANNMGLKVLLGAQPDRTREGLERPDLTSRQELWVHAQRRSVEERAPLVWAAVATAAGLLLFAVVHGAPPLWCIALVGPVLFSLFQMSSYDYMWLTVLLPLCVGETRLAKAVLGFVAFSAATRLWTDVVVEHVLTSLGVGALLAFIAWEAWQRLRQNSRVAER